MWAEGKSIRRGHRAMVGLPARVARGVVKKFLGYNGLLKEAQGGEKGEEVTRRKSRTIT